MVAHQDYTVVHQKYRVICDSTFCNKLLLKDNKYKNILPRKNLKN